MLILDGRPTLLCQFKLRLGQLIGGVVSQQSYEFQSVEILCYVTGGV